MSAIGPKRTFPYVAFNVAFGGQSGQPVLHCTCLRLTQSGHCFWDIADAPSNAPQRAFPSRTWPCVAHGLHYSCSCVCGPFFKMFVCPLVEGLNHRVI